MTIKIICLGKLKEKYLWEGIQEYTKRIQKYATIEIIELPDEPLKEHLSQNEILQIKKIEAEKIKKLVKSSEYVIALDLTGCALSSEQLAEKINQITLNGYSTITFLIGGTLGLSQEIVTNSNFILSFSKLTFPHQLIRLFLVEQIFRCFKINHHEKYHW